jgi:hypothetical protein
VDCEQGSSAFALLTTPLSIPLSLRELNVCLLVRPPRIRPRPALEAFEQPQCDRPSRRPPCSHGGYPRGMTEGTPLVCAECRRESRDDENAADEWRAYSDGVGELHVFCPECAEREFGNVAPS